MIKQLTYTAFLFCLLVFFYANIIAQTQTIKIFSDSVINDVSNHPVGINLNFLMDGGRFPNPKRAVADAMKDMGVKFLRYPGGEKSSITVFEVNIKPVGKKTNQ